MVDQIPIKVVGGNNGPPGPSGPRGNSFGTSHQPHRGDFVDICDKNYYSIWALDLYHVAQKSIHISGGYGPINTEPSLQDEHLWKLHVENMNTKHVFTGVVPSIITFPVVTGVVTEPLYPAPLQLGKPLDVFTRKVYRY